MANDTEKVRTLMDAMYSLADSLSEHRLLLREIRAEAKETNRLLERLAGAVEAGDAGDDVAGDAAPARATAEPAKASPASSSAPSSSSPAKGAGFERLMNAFIKNKLGFDLSQLEGMSEDEMMALAMEKGLFGDGPPRPAS